MGLYRNFLSSVNEWRVVGLDLVDNPGVGRRSSDREVHKGGEYGLARPGLGRPPWPSVRPFYVELVTHEFTYYSADT
jgi:hypothetical protein